MCFCFHNECPPPHTHRDWQVLVERCVEMSAADFMETRKSELDKFVANMRDVELVDERYSYLEHILDQLTEVVNQEHSWQSELHLYWALSHTEP